MCDKNEIVHKNACNDGIRSNDSHVIKPEERRAKFKKIAIMVTAGLVFVLVIIMTITMYFVPKRHYEKGAMEYKSGHYQNAIECFTAAKGFDDSEEMLIKSNYKAGYKCIERKKYNAAVNYFEAAANFKDAKKLKAYSEGMSCMESEKYKEAYNYFKVAGGVENSQEMLYACDLMEAEAYYTEGLLVDAQRIYKTLPTEFSFKGISVSNRLSVLDKYSAYVALLGNWSVSNGYMEVKQTHRTTGSWHNWYVEDPDGGFVITSCKILDDGSVCIEGRAEYMIYTKYSSLASVVDAGQRYQQESFSVTVKSLPDSVAINNYTKLTISNNAIKVNYYKYSPNEDVYFTYLYKTDMAYNKIN